MNCLRKTMAFMLSIIGMVSMFSGCSRDPAGNAEKDVPISDITEKLKSDLTWVDSMRQLEDSVIEKWYSFDSEKVESCEVYVAETGATAEEIAVVKLSDKSGLSDVEEIMQKRVDKRKKEFENYVPSEMYKLENAVNTNHGNYAALIICDDFEKAGDVFEECFK